MRRAGWLMVGLVVVATAAPALAAEDECCFTNPRYTGVCKVQPAEDETCADILEYLNNMNSVGKAYCGNTIIRGGWSQVDCEEGEGRTACVSAASTSEPTIAGTTETPPAP